MQTVLCVNWGFFRPLDCEVICVMTEFWLLDYLPHRLLFSIFRI